VRGGSRERYANGVVSALIVCFFLAHGTLGAVSLFTGNVSPLAWLVWVGVGLVAVHVALSALTSKQQLSDEEHPPSRRKVRHLALKWATGGLLAVAATAHVVIMRMGGDSAFPRVASVVVIVVVALALAVHLCVGAKSLLKDINVDRRHKMAFRVVVIAFCVAFALSALVTLAL